MYLLPVVGLSLLFSHLQFVYPNELKSAHEKQRVVYGKCLNQKGLTGQWPTSQVFRQFLAEDFNPTLDLQSDELPPNHIKAIHSIGTVATAKFESSGKHPFSGMFKGNPYLLVRLSLAGRPTPNKTIPAIAVKFFRDNLASANFVAMFSVDGHKSSNFFEKEFATHTAPPARTITKTLEKFFRSATNHTLKVGLSDIAMTDKHGNAVPRRKVAFPFKIILVPNAVLRKEYGGMDQTKPFSELLTDIAVGSKLYDVYGMRTSKSKKRIYIGQISTTSKLIKSKYADEVLFFKHQRWGEDLAALAKVKEKGKQKSGLSCPF